MNRHHDTLVMIMNPPDKLREVRLDLAERQSGGHGQKYDQKVDVCRGFSTAAPARPILPQRPATGSVAP